MTRASEKPIVVKLGGSLAESDRLRDMLAIVARARRRVVIVPGGGVFADAVRDAQAELGLPDEAAHRMAIRAMEQMAEAMLVLEKRLVGAVSLAAMRRAWGQRRVPVWLAARMALGDATLPRDWSITSDGLAASLAQRLGGVPVVLVKSCRVDASASAAALARRGVVDPFFASMVTHESLAWHVVGAGDEARFAELIASKPARGSAVAVKMRPERSTVRR